MKPPTPWLVFDVGGTKTSAARFDPASSRVTAVRTKTSPGIGTAPRRTRQPDPNALIELLQQLGDDVLDGARPEVVAVAMPGPVDSDGTLRVAPPLWGPGVGPFNAGEAFGRTWPRSRVVVLNDVSAAGYRYVSSGASDFSIVTVSSAIGSKVFLDGRPVLGPGRHGGEIGHLRIDPSADAEYCPCGERGHLAGRVSGRGMARLARKRASDQPDYTSSWFASRCSRPDEITERLLAEAFGDRDPWVARLIEEANRPLSAILAGLHLAVGIEDFIMIGGFAHALGTEYTTILAKQAAEVAWSNGADWAAMIRLGEPDQHDALIGAGFYAGIITGDQDHRKRPTTS